MSIYIWDKEIKNLFVPTKDYSAMRGPCPEGYHVPLNTEWQSVYNIWTALGWWTSDWNNFGSALKLPKAGYRSPSNAGIGNQGSYAEYHASSYYDVNASYFMYFSTSTIRPQDFSSATFGKSVRWFKDSPVVPTSSWTKLYWTSIEAGWIFWNSTDWLISLSSDWQTWITIADKNLGATTVWNSWDTLSEANSGKYYQWWNNYGFPRTWSVTTSSTRVNASTYWPWNYYNSSTFITGDIWDSSRSRNLWWWETWITETSTEAKAVYLWNTKVRESQPSLLTYAEIVAMANAEGKPWQNTIAELNNSPTEYYNMLSQGNHISYAWSNSMSWSYPIIDWIVLMGAISYCIYYINNLFVCDYSGGWSN